MTIRAENPARVAGRKKAYRRADVRVCECGTTLSVYNRSRRCYVHRELHLRRQIEDSLAIAAERGEMNR